MTKPKKITWRSTSMTLREWGRYMGMTETKMRKFFKQEGILK